MLKPVASLLLAGLLAACAGNPFNPYGLAPGTPRADVIARVVRMPSGERLQYSLQPLGQFAWNIDLDAAGRVIQSRQVLTALNFQRIEPGKWTREDVEREFGPPGRLERVSSWSGPIMAYRWNDGSDMFYWIYLDGNNVVQRAHPGMEFHNSPDRS